jgi:hypothetical protein
MPRTLGLAALAAALATALPAAGGPTLSVDAATARHPISDDIYGMNYAPEALAAELRLPVRRWGGNSTTRYNYILDVHNTGSDYYFENIPDGDGTEAGRSSNQFIDQDRRTGTRTLMTAPTIGWTPKRRLADHPLDCGFKVSKYPAQGNPPDDPYSPFNDDLYDPDCAKGRYANGGYVTGNDPTDTSVAIDPSFVTGWLNYLKGRYGTAAAGGVKFWSLDNEPGLWNSTHRDVHPLGMTYDELRDRAWQYGAAIKAADPTAKVIGPAEWGWCSYFYSPRDPGGCGPGPDRTAHGDLPMVVWYLQQMHAYEQAKGVRILDYLDLHFYPQAPGVALSPAGDANQQALRLRSTRALWDPSYNDESYIRDLDTGAYLQMIPRMRGWVADNYPGTKLAISEYNWGALDHINGALAQADVLGIFGREGLDLATIWDPPDSDQPGAFAFRMYRNYDGAGHGFGDTSLQASSSDVDTVSVYAAQRTSDQALTLLVVNKSASAQASTLNLANFAPQANASVYRYSTAAPGAIQHLADQPVTAAGFGATYPANSITLVVIRPALDPSADQDGDGIPNGVEASVGRDPFTKDNDVFGNSRLFAMQQYRDFLVREGDSGGIGFWSGQIDTAAATRGQVIESFFGSGEFQGNVSPVTRLYFAYFLRIPDYPGLTFWINYFKQGHPLDEISGAFASSPEFASRYGALGNGQFVDLVYNNVLGRAADPGGKAFWQGQLDGGLKTRGQVMLGFSESDEYKAGSLDRVYVTMMYVGMLRRAPDQGGFDFWVGYKGQGNSGLALINGFLASPEYHARFLP